MAGLFGLFDYTKEGPGIPKDAPPKPRFVIFFEVLGRKFWKIVQVNLLFGLCNIPSLILLYFIGVYFLNLPPVIEAIDRIQALNEIQVDPGELLFVTVLPLLSFLVCIPMITVGPAQAGMTYILRNYSREEHAFLYSDFFEHARKNFKQGMIVGTINFVMTILIMLDLYLIPMANMDALLKTATSTIVVVAFVLLMMMNMYIYPMMVTFKLSIRQLYKNALLFAFMKLIPNLLILIVCFAVVILPFQLSPPAGYLLFAFITMALISYITNFYVYTKIDKYMIQPSLQKETEQDQANDEQAAQEQTGQEHEEQGVGLEQTAPEQQEKDE